MLLSILGIVLAAFRFFCGGCIPKMIQKLVFGGIGFSLSFLSIWLVFFCTSCQHAPIKAKKERVEVCTVTVIPQTIPLAFEFIGVCQSSHLVEIRSRVQGYLQEICYKEGNFVKEGDLLFTLDPREFESHVAEVEA